jgi:hypothetical protein
MKIKIKQKEETFPFQARISKTLYERMKKLKEKNGWEWSDVVEGCFESLLFDDVVETTNERLAKKRAPQHAADKT